MWRLCPDSAVCFRQVTRILFVPYALHDRDAYTKTARDKLNSLGTSPLCAFTSLFNHLSAWVSSIHNVRVCVCVCVQVMKWTVFTRLQTPSRPCVKPRPYSLVSRMIHIESHFLWFITNTIKVCVCVCEVEETRSVCSKPSMITTWWLKLKKECFR